MYKITEKCEFCDTCIAVCPCDAIVKAYPLYYIDQELCQECGLCQEWCRFDAIEYVEE